MEHYAKGKNIEQDDCLPSDVRNALGDNLTWLRLTAGSQVGQQIPLAIHSINTSGAVVLSGSGAAMPKVVTVAELVKRRFRALHQLNRITQKEVIELWDPKLPDLETLKVTRQIPAITIVLSENQVLESLPQTSNFLSRFLNADGLKKQRRPNTRSKNQSEKNKENQLDQSLKKVPIRKREDNPQEGRVSEKESQPPTKGHQQENDSITERGAGVEQLAEDVKKRTKRRVRHRADKPTESSSFQSYPTKSNDLEKRSPEV